MIWTVSLSIASRSISSWKGSYWKNPAVIIFQIDHAAFMGTTDAQMWGALKEQFNFERSVEELIRLKQERFIAKLDQIPLVDNVLEFMTALRSIGCKLGLASSNNERSVEAIKNKFGLAEYIDVFVHGEAVTKGKPHPGHLSDRGKADGFGTPGGLFGDRRLQKWGVGRKSSGYEMCRLSE